MKLQRSNLSRVVGPLAAAFIAAIFVLSYRDVQAVDLTQTPSIKFTKVPPAGGGPERLETIAGEVSGVTVNECDCRIVLYSLTDQYWVQPFSERPYTELRDNRFEAEIHLGRRYFALLVKKSFRPAARLSQLPEVGGEVLAIASATPEAAKETGR